MVLMEEFVSLIMVILLETTLKIWNRYSSKKIIGHLKVVIKMRGCLLKLGKWSKSYEHLKIEKNAKN